MCIIIQQKQNNVYYKEVSTIIHSSTGKEKDKHFEGWNWPERVPINTSQT